METTCCTMEGTHDKEEHVKVTVRIEKHRKKNEGKDPNAEVKIKICVEKDVDRDPTAKTITTTCDPTKGNLKPKETGPKEEVSGYNVTVVGP